MGIGIIPAIVDLVSSLAVPAAAAADVGAGVGAADAGLAAADIGAGVGAADVGAGLGAGLAGPSVLGTAADFLAPGAAASADLGATGGVLGTIADTAAAPAAIGAGGLGAAGTAALGSIGSALGSGGLSAASAAAPLSANSVVSSDFGAIPASGDTTGFIGTAEPLTPGGTTGAWGITESAAGQPLSGLAADPTVVGATGAGAGGLDFSPLPSASDLFAQGAASSLGDAGAATLGGGSGGLSSLLGGAGTWIQNNPLMSAALGLEGLNIGKNLLFPTKLPNQGQLTGIANQAGAQAQTLNAEGQQFLQPSLTGQLPPQLEQQVQNALNDAINTTKSRYAQLGLADSTMQSDQISYLQQQAEAMRGTLAQQLAQTGAQLISQATSDLTLEANIYSQLMNAQISQDNALETSVAQFAGALTLSSVLGAKKAA